MIRFDRSGYFGPLLAIEGGILQELFQPTLYYGSYTLVVFVTQTISGVENVIEDHTKSGLHFIGGFVSFLLIFRLNQCYDRFVNGQRLCSEFFNSLENMLGIACAYIGHWLPADVPEEAQHTAANSKAHIARLILATSAAFRFHTRIADGSITGTPFDDEEVPQVLFDYGRVHGLLLPEESRLVNSLSGLYLDADPVATSGAPGRPVFDANYRQMHPDQWRYSLRARLHYKRDRVDRGPAGSWPLGFEDSQRHEQAETIGVALPLVIIGLLRHELLKPLSKVTGETPWGYPERVLNLMEVYLKSVTNCLQDLDRLITVPLSLPYLQHCKIVFLFFVIVYPLIMDLSKGFWANVVVPVVIFFSLLGFETLADQLENPLGNDHIDVNVLQMMHSLDISANAIFRVEEGARRKLQANMATAERYWAGQATKLDVHLAADPEEGLSVDTARIGRFSTFFRWEPLPHLMQGYLAETFLSQHDIGHDVSRSKSRWRIGDAPLDDRISGSQPGQAGSVAPSLEEHHESDGSHFVCLELKQDAVRGFHKYLDSVSSQEDTDGPTSASRIRLLLQNMTSTASPWETKAKEAVHQFLNAHMSGGRDGAAEHANVEPTGPSVAVSFSLSAGPSGAARSASPRTFVRYDERPEGSEMGGRPSAGPFSPRGILRCDERSEGSEMGGR